MASFKALYLGVYASNGLIRLLFLPLCYLLLVSPFALLVGRRYKIDQQLFAWLPDSFTKVETLPQIFIAGVSVLFVTRLTSGRSDAKDGRGKRRIQFLPYWIPGVRHWGNLVFGGENWLRGVRDLSVKNVIAYNAAGAQHHVILSSGIFEKLLQELDSLEESDATRWYQLCNVFSMPRGIKDRYLELRLSISETVATEVFKGKQTENLIAASLTNLSQSLPDLITFNSSIVDQMAWERVAAVELTEGTEEAECELFNLLNEFVCNAILPPITGLQFPESYQLMASDLSTLTQSFYPVALGLPRVFPVRRLPGAILARKQLLRNFTRLFNELTYPPTKNVPEDDESVSGEETDADTPTPLTALNDLFNKHDVPMQARAAIALELIHNIVSQVVPLAFWTLLHIYSGSSNVAKEQDANGTPMANIRAETKNWAKTFQPPSIHPSFPAPPEIRYATKTHPLSATSFPHLRSCISEARRIYTAPIRTFKVDRTIKITDSEKISTETSEKCEFAAGSYIDLGFSQSLINTSPANHLSPNDYKPDRFLNNPPPPCVDLPIDPSSSFTTALLVSIIAGITQLWNITPAPKKSFFQQLQEAQAEAAGQKTSADESTKKQQQGSWIIPKAIDGKDIKLPKTEVKVRIRRREGLEGPKAVELERATME